MLALKLGQSLPSSNSGGGFVNKFSLQYDGVDDYFTANGAVNVFDEEAGTMSLWVKLNSVSAAAQAFNTSVDSNNKVTILYNNSNGKLSFIYRAGGTNTRVDIDSSIENDGNWHHLAMTWNRTTNELLAFVDGSQVGTTQTISGTWAGTPSVFEIGRNALIAASFWNGNIDEVALYITALDAAGITSIYNAGSPTDLIGTGGLRGYWRNEKGSGTAVVDLSGAGNNGTLVNGTTFSTTVP